MIRRAAAIQGAAAIGVALASLTVTAAPPATAGPPAACSGTRTPASFRACIAMAASVYTAVWAPELLARGASATPPTVSIFTGIPFNSCVDATVGDIAVASFWCDKDVTVYVSAPASPYWTREYAREAKRQGVLASDARRVHRTQKRLLRGHPNQGAATELAHELGHWVQYATGFDDYYFVKGQGTTKKADMYRSASELSADCMAGWVQGRGAASGSWRDTPFIRWAGLATIAELGGDLSGMRPNFVFPKDSTVIGHGGANTRLAMYKHGFSLGARGAEGIDGCAAVAARSTGTQPPPSNQPPS